MPNVAFAIGVMSMRSATELVASYFEPQPDNPSRASWTASVLALLIFLNLLAVVLESIDSVNSRFVTEFFLFECFSIFFFTMEYIARIYSAPALVTTVRPLGKSRRLGYVSSFSGLIDLIAILPFLLQFLIPGIDLRVLRALRLLRLLKLNQYTSAIDDLIAAVVYERKALLAAVYLLMVSLFLSSTAVYLVESISNLMRLDQYLKQCGGLLLRLRQSGTGILFPYRLLEKLFLQSLRSWESRQLHW